MEHSFYYFHHFMLDRGKALCEGVACEPAKNKAFDEHSLPSCVPHLPNGGAR